MANCMLASELLDRIENDKKAVKDKTNKPDCLKDEMDKHGLYRWYATDEKLKELLCSKYLCIERPDGTKENSDNLPFYKEYMDNLGNALPYKCYNGTTYYCIYVGKTMGTTNSKMTLYKRVVGQHIHPSSRKSHGKSDVDTLSANYHATCASTFRKTIASLIAGDLTDAENTDGFIDNLLVEWLVWPDNTLKTYCEIKAEEDNEIKNYVCPLNIDDNNRSELSEFRNRLQQVRDVAEIVALKKCSDLRVLAGEKYKFVNWPQIKLQ